MVLARRNDIYLIKRGDRFTVEYKTGSVTVSSRIRANKLYDKLTAK